jgi:hypothetical protein
MFSVVFNLAIEVVKEDALQMGRAWTRVDCRSLKKANKKSHSDVCKTCHTICYDYTKR